MNELDARLRRLSPEKLQLLARELERRERALSVPPSEPIAIVGMGCRFPGGSSPEAFWSTLREGVDLRRPPPVTRYEVDSFYDPNPNRSGRSYTKLGYFVDHVDQFDAALFGISAREAKAMDPQQRVLLEVTHDALEHAAIAPSSLAGTDAGVFLGIYGDEYLHLQVWSGDLDSIDAHTGTGTSHSIACGRVSHWLGTHGPSISLDTACSSSLAALHLACESLKRGECGLALAAGVSLCLSPEMPVTLSRARMLAPDGRSKTFDASADGYGRGEGCGVLVLKRLSDAEREGHSILAVIRGSALNHDGRASTLTAPNGLAQEAVLRSALRRAELTPDAIDFIEAHGTGTPLGDPIEVQALAAVFGSAATPRVSPLLVGAVKANIGHLEAAAGIAGVIKVVLALQAEELPAQLHLRKRNPYIEVPESMIRILDERTRWSRSQRPRIAGVSSFGFGGTNAHVIIGEAPPRNEPESPATNPRLLTLSAQTESALDCLAERYEGHLEHASDRQFVDTCFTAAVGRDRHRHRLAIVSGTAADARNALHAFRQRLITPDWVADQARDSVRPVFLFTGQGSQYPGMGGELLEREVVFRDAFLRCAELARPYLDRDLVAVVHGGYGPELQQTQYTQPALFALEYALTELWRAWGIEPAAVAGHSVGEYVAACVAGVFDVETAVRLVCARGRLMGSLPKGGAMAAIQATEQHVRSFLVDGSQISLAALNAPESVVLSGPEATLNELVVRLEQQGIECQRLQTSHAFHSALMDPILEPFERELEGVRPNPPRVPLISNITGRIATAELMTSRYFCSQLREPVRFYDSLRTLCELGHDLFLELGPRAVLSPLGANSGFSATATWLSSLKRAESNTRTLHQAAAGLYVRGCSLRLPQMAREGARISGPRYPFQREHHWLESATRGCERLTAATRTSAHHPLIGTRVRLANGPIVFRSVLGAGIPAWLTDHRLLGQIVVPGACYVAMLLCAARESLPESHELRDVVFPQPMVLGERERREVQIVLQDGSARVYASDASDTSIDPTWVTHAEARLRPLVASSHTRFALEAVESRCANFLSGADFYTSMAEVGFGLGPRFQWVEQVGLGTFEALARMRAPHEEELSQYPYLPGFLDACFQLLAAAIAGGAEPTDEHDLYVPLSVDSIAVHASVPGPRVAHVLARAGESERAQFEGDITLYDSAGTAVLTVEGLRVRRATSEMLVSNSTEADLYQATWQALPYVPGAVANGAWLVLGPLDARGQALVERRRALGSMVLTLADPDELVTHANGATSDPNADRCKHVPGRAVTQAWAASGPFEAVLFWNADHNEAAVHAAARALHVAQATLELRPPPRLWFVTRGSSAASGAVRHFQSSGVHGLGRVIAAEHPTSWGGLIDLDPDASVDDDLRAVVDALAPSSGPRENELAYRGDKKFGLRLRGVPTGTARRELAIRAAGSYLITGGLGGLGLAVARWLVERGARALVLNGRSAPSPAAARAIELLERAGAHVALVQGDIADPELTALLVASARARGPLLGIFHAAGTLDDGIVVEQTAARLSRVFSAKVDGALNLHYATRDLPLEHFVLFSSVAGLLGAPGQANYAAANTFLDGFASWRQGQGLAACSVAWGPWAEVGMAAGKSTAGAGLIEAFSTNNALALLTRALEYNLPNVAALRADWRAWGSRFAPSEMPLVSGLIPRARANEPVRKETSELSISDLASAPEEDWQQLLALKLQTELARVLHVEPSRIDVHQRINALGLDSLMSVELKNKIEVGLGLRISVGELLKGPTLHQLAEHLIDLLDKDHDAEPAEYQQHAPH